MNTKFNFNSQVCTSKIQSERLLALGLKKETADMVYIPHYANDEDLYYEEPEVLIGSLRESVVANDEGYEDYIPAWSLGRLLEMAYDHLPPHAHVSLPIGNLLGKAISVTEHFIKEGYFNKEYLEE